LQQPLAGCATDALLFVCWEQNRPSGWLWAVRALTSRLISLAGAKWSCLRINQPASPPAGLHRGRHQLLSVRTRSWTSARAPYRGTSLIRNHLPLGAYSSICLGPFGSPGGGGRLLMSEVPLYPEHSRANGPRREQGCGDVALKVRNCTALWQPIPASLQGYAHKKTPIPLGSP